MTMVKAQEEKHVSQPAARHEAPTLPKTFQDCSITLNTKQVSPKAIASVRAAFPGLVLELKESAELDEILGMSVKPGSHLTQQHSAHWPNIPRELGIHDGIVALEYYVEQTILQAADKSMKSKILGFFSKNKS